MAGTLEIRRKIRSIKSTRQITRAMELVAAAKMKKAIFNTTALRPYAAQALSLLVALGAQEEGRVSPAEDTASRLPGASVPKRKSLVILITSDRGLCGGYNIQLIKHLLDTERKERVENPDQEFEYIAIGKKGQEFLSRSGRTIVAAYNALSNHPSFEDTLAVSKMALSEFGNGNYERVILCYQLFVSALVQRPLFQQLLPFSREVFESTAAEQGFEIDDTFSTDTEYAFEPSREFILENLLPRLTEMQIYQAVLEATASEHSARMVAMKNATNNASDFISSLTLMYNQIRQASITQEIAEISAGRIALGF